MSIASIVTRGRAYGGVASLVTHGLVSADAETGFLGGKAYPGKKDKKEKYSFVTPYQEMLAAKKEVVEVKEAIDHAAIERASILSKLEHQDILKAAQQKKLEKNLLKLDIEMQRLTATLMALELLIRQWDEEDAMLVLALSMPFAKIY